MRLGRQTQALTSECEYAHYEMYLYGEHVTCAISIVASSTAGGGEAKEEEREDLGSGGICVAIAYVRTTYQKLAFVVENVKSSSTPSSTVLAVCCCLSILATISCCFCTIHSQSLLLAG